MNSKIFFVILIILAGVIIFGTTLKPKNELLTQNKTMGVVDVKITPVSVDNNKELVFELVMDNHSIDLSYDYTKIAVLTDNNDNSIYPSSWTGNSSGHHVEGKLLFPSFSKNPKELTLTLNGVDNKIEAFNWKL
ncbi:MAG: hypothetical protein Q8P20_05795 [bacterium]|nr:hypothetical protein [bacterium]